MKRMIWKFKNWESRVKNRRINADFMKNSIAKNTNIRVYKRFLAMFVE
jgi:hypothetical protein